MTLDLSLIQQQMDQLMADHSEQNRTFYDLFFNPTTKDVVLKQYVGGVLTDVTIPNRAKMIDWYGKGLNPPIRQSVLQGKANAATGAPAFLNAVGTQVEVDASPDGLLLAFAAGYTDTGPLDYIAKVSQDVNVPGLTANATNYLYAERNAASGAVTFGATTLAPAWQATAPANPQAGQHWLDPVGMVMKTWTGAAWEVKQRLFIGTAVLDAGGNVTSVDHAPFLRGTLPTERRSETGVLSAGDVVWRTGNVVPAGFLKCNGATVSRTVYADLFAAIGATYGAGDGASTFALPDLRGEFIRGWDDSRGVDAGRVLGSAQGWALKDHQHSQFLSTAGSGFAAALGGLTTGTGGQLEAPGDSGVRGIETRTSVYGGAVLAARLVSGANVSGDETRPRNVALMACIKY